MESTSLVSVIVPTYNRESYLPRAIESVFAQTYARWELLVADDGSTDGTRDYLRGLTDPRVTTAEWAHVGNPAAVLNAALAMARGRYVAFLDSDDWWEPEKLALQLQALREHPACRWSYTLVRQVDDAGRELQPYHREPYMPGEGWVLQSLISGETPVLRSAVLAERRLIEDAGGFDPSFPVAEDLELWIRLAGRSPAATVGKVLATRRRHASNYGGLLRDTPEAMARLFERLLARVPRGAPRRALRWRRARWLVKVAADREGAGRSSGLAWLARALPEGLAQPAWWVALLKTVLRAVAPRPRD